ncbi:MAG: Myxococcus phage Mx8 [Pseudomonadota bacterium]|jgi:hypothetical protein
MEQGKITSASDFKDTPQGLAQRWNTEISAAKQELTKFHEDAKRIVHRYLDKRDDFGRDQSRVNLFWSTMQVLLSMLYARPPRADVSRSWQDSEDDEARVAGTIMQRLLNRSFDDNVSPWDATVRNGIEDWLTVGMGQMWLRYEVKTEPYTIEAVVDEMGNELSPASEAERITEEDAPCDYVYWDDFFWSPARTWSEVRWVARRVYMTKDQLVERFGKDIASVVPLSRPTREGNVREENPQNDPWNKGEVFEIWCKENKKVYWYAKGADVILDVKDDPLGLENFFPCPKPLIANATTSNFMPRADYIMAQDQFNELDEINTRITWLTRAAKIAGVYDKTAGDSVGRMFSQASENQLIPVDNWAMFAEAGGVKGKIDFAPIDQVVNCINQLRQYRQDKVMQIYEVLGVSDVMRGSSKASETATAQQIKAQYGSTRVQLKQFYIAEWICNGLRIKAEIICKHFQPETMVKRSNIERTPDVQFVPGAIALLKNEEMAEYRINVEADSMAALDWAAERDAAVQFLQGMGAFVSQVAPMAQQNPEAAPILMKLLQWGVAKFRVSTEIESVLDQAIASMNQKLQTPPQPPQPTIEQQIEMQKIQSNEKIAMMESETDKEIAALKGTIDLQKIEMQAKMDQMTEQFSTIKDMLSMNPESGQKLGELLDNVSSIAQGALQTQLDTQQQMRAVMEAVGKKKRRVPIRDPQTGDILEVREMDDEPDLLPGTQAALAGGAPLPPAVTPQVAPQPQMPI